MVLYNTRNYGITTGVYKKVVSAFFHRLGVDEVESDSRDIRVVEGDQVQSWLDHLVQYAVDGLRILGTWSQFGLERMMVAETSDSVRNRE